MHDHSHHRSDHHAHHHPAAATPRRVLLVALALTLAFGLVEALTGWWSGSLALVGDAGHMFADSLSLGLAALASWVARRPPSARHSYGLVRAEVLAAAINGLLLLLMVALLAHEALERIGTPVPVAGGPVMLVAFGGLCVNLLVAWMLSRGGPGLNVRAAMLHVFGDILGSVAAIASGTVIYFTGWTTIDPLLSLLIAALILGSTVALLREVVQVLMEGVPPHLDLDVVGRRLAQVSRVSSVHDLHIWTLSSGTPALSAHLVLADLGHWPEALAAARRLLHDEFGIDHVTLQPELPAAVTMAFVPRKR